MSVQPLNKNDLSPGYVLGATMEHVEKIRCVAVVAVYKDGSYGVQLSNTNGMELAFMSRALDEFVSDVIGGRSETARIIPPKEPEPTGG